MVVNCPHPFSICQSKIHLQDFELDNNESFLTKVNNDKIDTLCDQYRKIHEITKDLQSDKTTAANVRTMLDAVIRDFSETKSRLSRDAKIVRNNLFQDTLVKIQNGTELSNFKIEQVKCL